MSSSPRVYMELLPFRISDIASKIIPPCSGRCFENFMGFWRHGRWRARLQLDHQKPTWGTCVSLILLADSPNQTKNGGQELIGGLHVRVNRNNFGCQTESFQAPLGLPFLRPVGHSSSEPSPPILQFSFEHR